MLGKNISKISHTVMNFFNTKVDEADSSIHFVERKSKLNAALFIEVLVSGCLSDPRISLERLCKLFKDRGVSITKQGLHQRFNPKATLLTKRLFTESLNQFKADRVEILDLLKPFSSVKMQDSSGVSLPKHLQSIYKGCGGNASESGVKLQVLFNYTQGQLEEVTMTEGCRSDQGFGGPVEPLEKGALYLQDLGYFKVSFFEKVRNKEAFFVSRYLHQTKLFTESGEPMDVLTELKKTGPLLAKKVRLGQKEKVEARFIAFRLSDEDVKKRHRKMREKAQKRGRTPTQESLELARWSLYVTNVPEEVLSDEQVYLVYSLRWQIELLFKLFKSEVGVDKVSGRSSDRIVCELYAKLICVVMLLYVCLPVRWQGNQELSLYKAYRALKLRAIDFFRALQSEYRMLKFIAAFLDDLKGFSLKDKHRQKRRLTYQKIMDTVGQGVLA